MGDSADLETIVFNNDTVTIILSKTQEGAVFLQDVYETNPGGASTVLRKGSLPLCEVRLSGEGNESFKSSKSLIGSSVSSRLRYSSHLEGRNDNYQSKTLDVKLQDAKTGIVVVCHLEIFQGLPFVRSSATIHNAGAEDIVVTQLSSLVISNLTGTKEWWSDYALSVAKNTWFREAQWNDLSLPDIGVDNIGIYSLQETHVASLASFSVSNRGTFSTQGHLPMGLLKRRDGGETWLWQIESNGSWTWEIGDYRNGIFLAATGPNSIDHEWRKLLKPGMSFTSVTVSLCHLFDDDNAAFSALTQYRRRTRRKHVDNVNLPIIFNDYMNCLMGDPTDEKILALVEPVAKSGAEYFVIDCGWYADDNNWWDDVGTWEPSKKRFPMGFDKLLDNIRSAGLKPGLWLEPEVIGLRSSMAKVLPDEAFFQRDGQRIIEKKRYHLDFRHPAVLKHMDEVVARLITQYGVTYFKFDYNVEIVQGTDVNCSSAGVGQLEHNRAYIAWITSLLDRYPDLVIENCSSGGQRMDYSMLSVYPLQSTSDQQDPALYASIAASIPTAVTPEQAATWAYPQPDWDDETNALTVVNSLLGRIHLSGRLDIMSAAQLDIVYEGMAVYKSIRADIATALPFWPLGLPKWQDEWLALGLKVASASGSTTDRCYLAVWRRGGSETCDFPIAPFRGRDDVRTELLYPAKFVAESSWEASDSVFRVRLPLCVCARLYRLSTF